MDYNHPQKKFSNQRPLINDPVRYPSWPGFLPDVVERTTEFEIRNGKRLVFQLALTEISAIKVVAPNVLQMVVDAAIQIHGGEGMCDFELNMLLASARALRIADGPDEVHRGLVARLELKKYA
jgi:alkylation response protein AidB-like acyl-CoA dehydrogenase